jgi:hypothetical protein
LNPELVALANDIVSGVSGAVTAASIQAALDAAHAKLTAMQVVLDYINDQGSTAPDADDYNAIGLGRAVVASEVPALNAAAVAVGVTAADTPAELAALLPLPSVTIDAISEDSSAYPPMRDLGVAPNTDLGAQAGDILIDISTLQVGDYLTLTLNGISYTTQNALSAVDMDSVRAELNSANTELTSWKAATDISAFYNHNGKILVRPTATAIDISALEVKAGVAVTPDFITSDNDGLTITATLDAALATGQRLEFSTNGTNWTDISDSVTGTAVSYDASSLTSTATVQMRVVNTAGTAGTADSQLVTIDATSPVVVISSSATTNDTYPVVSGTVETGATVTAVIAGATYKVTSTDGTWSVDTATAIPVTGSLALNTSGDNSISVTAVDVAGNASAAAATQTLVIDTVAPDIAPSGLVQLDAYGLDDVPSSGDPLIASAAFANGSFVEVWLTKRDTAYGVVAQRFNADGSKDGEILGYRC